MATIGNVHIVPKYILEQVDTLNQHILSNQKNKIYIIDKLPNKKIQASLIIQYASEYLKQLAVCT